MALQILKYPFEMCDFQDRFNRAAPSKRSRTIESVLEVCANIFNGFTIAWSLMDPDVATIAYGKEFGIPKIGLSCQEEFTNCDNSGIRHLPLNETWHFELDGSWSLALLMTSEAETAPLNNASFKGYLTLTRIKSCEIKMSLQNMIFGSDRETFSETVVIRVDGSSVEQICREKGLYGGKRSEQGAENERDDQMISLASNIISAITNNGMDRNRLRKGEATVVEEDNFGVCPTHYTMKRTSRSNFWIKKSRNLKLCGNTIKKFASESGEILWHSDSLQSYVEKSEWECVQYYVRNRMKRLECSHEVTMTETSEFTSNLTLIYLSSDISNDTDSTDLVESNIFLPKSVEKLKPAELYENAQMFLKEICKHSRNGIQTDSVLSFPKIMAIMNNLSKETILKLYHNAKTGTLCPDNEYFMGLFVSILRDTVSPAASSAKCQITLEDDVPLNVGWASSLANTVIPTEETLKQCSALLSLSSWTKSVLGVSSLAGTFRSNHCHSKSKDYDSCDLGNDFHSITRTLWLKAGNCLNPDKEYQKMALWAIHGLANLDSVGTHVTTTLISCVNSQTASTEVKIASLRALEKKMCNFKTSSWIQNLVFKEDLSSEFRIEAFKTLLQCNDRAARELMEMVTRGDVDLKSSQVTSFVESFSNFQNGTSLLKLSRHFKIDLDGILGLQKNSKLEGDLIFDDSFLPRSFNLNFYSSLLKQFGGVARLELRQKNLEEVLQPLIGPEGVKESLQSLLQEVILSFFESLRNPVNESSEEVTRQKRSLNVDDVKTALTKVKRKLTEKLHTMISAGLGNNQRYFSTYSFDPFFNDFQNFLEEYVDTIVRNFYSSIANYQMSSGFSWGLRSEEAFSWTFLGRRLSLRQYEGVIATLKMSSHLSLFSLMKSPFNPSIDVNFNPSIGGYWHSSMEFAAGKEVTKAKLESPLHAGFNIHIKMKPKIEEHLEINLDLPKHSFHGYSATISKELLIKEEILDLGVESSRNGKLKEKGLGNELLPQHPMKTEAEYLHCDKGFWDGLGLKSCLESSVWRGERSSLVHSKFGLSKVDDGIDHFRIFITSKNPEEKSVFVSAVVETEGTSKKREGTFVLGFNLSPHATLRILATGGKYARSFEATVVNDPNLKRLEVRSKVGAEEYGLKAEILTVQDGGQLSIKPRLVVSRPTSMEDALLDGYIAHYSSDKVKSFTLDLVTEGSLKRIYDIAIKGTTEYRWKPGGEWSLSLKNLHLISPALDFGLEASLNVNENSAEISSQVTWDGDVAMLGADLRSSDVTDSEAKYELALHFLSPSKPQLDTKVTLVTSLYEEQISNNMTVLNGPENSRWSFNAFHSTAWKFIYTNTPNPFEARDLWNGLLKKGRTARITNAVHLNIPSCNWEWKLDHSFQVSDFSLENQVTLHYLQQPYTIMTNFYDQSKDKFKYHMEIEMNFPDWKFSYVDTLLERNKGDIVGHSVATMPSGRIYTSSSQLKYENVIDYLIFEVTCDTLVRNEFDEFRISFRLTLENTPNHLTFQLSLDNPEPVVGVEFSLEGLGTQPVDVFLKVFLSQTFEAELTSRSTGAQTEVGLSLDLISYSKLIKSKVAVGRRLSGGGVLDGEVVLSSPENPSFDPMSITVSSSLEFQDPGIYLVKSDLSVMGWGWSAELRTQLGQKASDLQKFTVTVTLPDESSFEGESYLLFDFQDDEQNLGSKTEIKLPSGVIYKLSIGGGSSFHKRSLAEASLHIDIDSPFTKKMFLKTHARSHLSGDERDFTFFCNTNSEANYWNELQIDFNWKLERDTSKTVFVGKFGEKRVNLESFGSYTIENDLHKVKMVTEVKLPSGGAVEQLKASFDGELFATSYPRGVKMSQTTFVQRNHADIFRSSGDLEVNIPKTKGSFVVTHYGKRFPHQEYKMEGTFTGQELKFSIQGMVDRTPVRMNIHYIDGETLKVFASYGGSSYASMEFTSQLEGFSLALREASSSASKLTTSGQITFRNRQTRFHHILRVSQTHSSSNLRINSLRGKPVRIFTSRTKIFRNEWKTEGKIEWGRLRVVYSDEIAFRSFKDFDVKVSLNAPSFGLRDLLFHVISSHYDVTDQTLSIKYTREDVIIHSGSFFITTSSLHSSSPFEINAELVNIVIDKKEYSDFKFRQYLALPKNGIELESLLKRGGTRLAELGLSASEDRRKMLFAVCSTRVKCVRFKGETQSFSQNSPIRNFAVEVKLLNSLFFKKSDDDIVEHSMVLTAENKYKEGEDVRLSGKLSRSLCNDVLCEDSFQIGKHNIHLTASPRNMDVLYETQNRTILLKTSLIKGINKNLAENDSKLLKIQFWFDRIKKPDNVLIWTTTYEIFDSDKKVEEVVESVIQHPYVDRPVSVSGKLSSLGNFRREALIDLDIFEEPHHALQLHILKDYEAGGYKFQMDLKNVEEEQPHLSFSAVLIPSPDAGLFDLSLDTPLLTSNQESESRNISFRYKCNMEVNKQNTELQCNMNSVAVSEDFGLAFGYTPDPCTGARASSNVFQKTYKVYGVHCDCPLNVAAGVSLTDNVAEDATAKIGFVDPNVFEVDLFGVTKGDVTLYPPFLLQGSFHPFGSPQQKLRELKTLLYDEWNHLIVKSKSTTAKILQDSKHFLQVFDSISKPSQIEELSKIFCDNSKNVFEELRNDELFLDISRTVETSVNISSDLIDVGLSYLESVTGNSLGIKPLSFYTSKLYDITLEVLCNFLSNVHKEMIWFMDYTKGLVTEVTWWIQDTYNYVLNESGISEPLKWLQYKIKLLLSPDSWPSVIDAFKKMVHAARKTLSVFYSDINKGISGKYSILIPLSESFYNLESVFMTPFGEDYRRYSVVSLQEEINKWIHSFLHPQELIEEILPPYNAQGTIVRDSLITFDGNTHSLDLSCPHLLLALKGRIGTTPIALASGRLQEETRGRSREFLLLVGDDTIRVTPDRNILLNNYSLSLPYQQESFWISRDLTHVTITLRDTEKRKLLSFTCGVHSDACVIDVNGWLFSDLQGLLGTFDYDSFNDYTKPDGTVTPSGEIWEASWRINDNCSGTSLELASPETEPDPRFKEFCTTLLLNQNSFAVPCHSTVNVSPYYTVCLKSLQTVQFSKKRIKRSSRNENKISPQHEDRESSENNSTILHLPRLREKTIILRNQTKKRKITHIVIDDFVSIWKKSKHNYDAQMLVAKSEETEIMCDVASAYSSVCSKHNIILGLPFKCDSSRLATRDNKMELEPSSVDLLILFEETECAPFIHKHLLSSLHNDVKEIINSMNVDISIRVGVVGYGSSEGGPLTYYGKGSSLLVPLKRFIPPDLSNDHEGQGTLTQAFSITNKFPFRKGSIRVVFVASCSNQDLPKLTSNMTKEIRNHRLIVFVMTDEQLVNHVNPKTIRNTVGIDSEYSYHLRKGKISRENSALLLTPTSNIAQLSIQSGGGVFSVAGVKSERKAPYYMKLFRQIFVKTLLESSKKLYRDIKKQN